MITRQSDMPTTESAVQEIATGSSPLGEEDSHLEDGGAVYRSTTSDIRAMKRLGRGQELVRHYRTLSMVSFVVVANQAWELTLFQASPAIINGGLPSMVWSVLWSFVGYIPIILSMAEMASMAPIAGAQYHWVSEFAPESCQRILSYVTGWTSTLAWQAGNATGLFLVGTLVQCIILVNKPDYSFPNWHGTILAIATIAICVVVNIYGSKIVPYWQNAALGLSVAVYIAFLVVIWLRAPVASSREVWTDWKNSGGWPSTGLAVMVGQLPALTAFTGVDTAAHMSEEVRNAATSIPQAMCAIFILNFCQIFLTTVTMAYHLPNVTEALHDPTTYPAIYMLRQAMPVPWVTVMLTLIAVLLMVGNISYLVAVSRDLFAFARDNGLPFSPWLAKVDPISKSPTNAYITSGVFCALLSLIYVGSSVAFYAIVSLNTVALLQCYIFSIGCVLWRRMHRPETLPEAPFSLGKYGIVTNATALVWGSWSFFWCFWPEEHPITAGGFNWSSPIFVITITAATVYYYLGGRQVYHGPVTLVQNRKI
ncbi:hypothetical protein NLG97_g4640 [Lecanicillium saksenae]|uniref:Uncharacterized protein n=1 Tax=Lecanicillium saksenae TaxID=468837 RepID=A0ACC1QW13_9HYPO|nr:hypothetical protein NLG97_g4640 [Lecanicillium saksenae]